MEAIVATKNALPDVKVKTVYYICPIGSFAKEAVAEYLDAVGLDRPEGVSIHYGGKRWASWRVPKSFFGQILQKHYLNPGKCAFQGFHHPRDDRTAIAKYDPPKELYALGDILSRRLEERDGLDLVQVIDICPGVKADKKRGKR